MNACRNSEFDVVIVGGGPAGSTAAILLAQGGKTVCLIEKERYPRFHIGESLLPAGNRILKQIGVWQTLHEEGFIEKRGAEFTYGDGRHRVHNVFSDGLLAGMDYSFQVDRSRFDTLLLDRAQTCGCTVLQPARVASAAREGAHWSLDVDAASPFPQALKCRWLLDAAGRSRFLGSRLNIEREPVPVPGRFAVFNHFRGVHRKAGPEGGDIIIVRVEDGWFWSIPLDVDKTSVGLVKLRRPGQPPPGEELFQEEVRRSSLLNRLMHGAHPVDEWRVEADFSYIHKSFAGKNHLLLGDAAGFIDPVFSSGVYLGMESGAMAANAILARPAARGYLTRRGQRRYTRALRRRMNVMLSLVRVFYHPADFSIFMSPTGRLSLFQAVNSVVAGNTAPAFPVRCRFRLFLLICRLNRVMRLVPEVDLAPPTRRDRQELDGNRA